jgi:hypothetical protein
MATCTGPGGVALTFDGARLACQGVAGWHLATLDTPLRVQGAPLLQPPDWVGARRNGSSAPFVWSQSGSAVVASEIQPVNAIGDCLVLTMGRTFTNDTCALTGSNALHRFICDTHP